MSNHAYMSVWCGEFSEERMLGQIGAMLATVPFSAVNPGFTNLTIRAVDSTEAPVLEQDLRSAPLDAGGIMEIAKDHLHGDSSYEVRAFWDLWVFDPSTSKWKLEPQALDILFHGEDYDEGFWRETGHVEAHLGLEHLFTGHAGLLGLGRAADSPAETMEEARFIEMMAWPENLHAYHEKTRENIRKLLDWMRRIEATVADGRMRLWSEGEENFEARIEEILAVR